MSIITKEMRVCDYCQRECGKKFIKIEPYPNEGCSTLTYDKITFEFGFMDFCCTDCFVYYMRVKLTYDPEF